MSSLRGHGRRAGCSARTCRAAAAWTDEVGRSRVCLRDGGRGRLCGGRGWVGRRDADHRGRRGLPRSGLHLAYVAVGRGQGRVAARRRGRAPHRGRVVSAAPALGRRRPRGHFPIGGGVPLAAEFYRRVFTDDLLGPGGTISSRRVDLAVHLAVLRLLADGAAACRSLPPQGVAPSCRPHPKVQLTPIQTEPPDQRLP